MVDRLDLKTGDTLDEAVFATIDDNVAELDRTKANSSDIPEVPDIPDVSGFVTQTDIDNAVSGLASESSVSDKADQSAVDTLDDRVDSLASRLDALEASSGDTDDSE
ncbi:hypothetical protein PQI66_00360 [Corynebacterium sp. USCH3]|uniref:hypothetical protein n=1 Tax=Corynebacterium sp. USCH3 TaxID=3024840 RepID=UPI00309EF2FF